MIKKSPRKSFKSRVCTLQPGISGNSRPGKISHSRNFLWNSRKFPGILIFFSKNCSQRHNSLRNAIKHFFSLSKKKLSIFAERFFQNRKKFLYLSCLLWIPGHKFICNRDIKLCMLWLKSPLGHIRNHLDHFMRPSASTRAHKYVLEFLICPSESISPMT